MFNSFFVSISEFKISINSSNELNNDDDNRTFEKDNKFNDPAKIIKEGHRVHLSNYQNNKDLYFFITKLIFYEVLLIFLFLTFKNKNEKFKKYIIPIIFSTILIYIFIFMSDIIYSKVFGYSEFLVLKLDRLIFNRFLNLNNISFIVLSLSFFFKICSDYKNNKFISSCYKILLIFLSLGILIFGEKNLSNLGFYGSYIKYYSLIIWFICISSIILYFSYINNLFFINKNKNLISNKIKNDHVEFFLILSILFFLIFNLCKNNYEKNTSNIKLLNNIKSKNVILFGGNIYGNLDLLYYGENTWLIPDPTEKIKNVNYKSDIDIFCLEELKNQIFLRQNDFHDFINNVCFPERQKNEWADIKKNYGIEYVIVPKKSLLKLNKVAQNKYYTVYKI